MDMVVARSDEALEKRVRPVGFALEFRMELAGDEKWMVFQFDDLHQLPVGRKAAKDEPGLLESLAVDVVEFVAVAMPLVHEESPIKVTGQRAQHQLARLGTQPHGAAFLGNLFL